MATIRISNIEAKADASSPSIDERVTFKKSTGENGVVIDAKQVGVSSVGINSDNPRSALDVVGDVNITGSYYGDGSGLTGVIDVGTGIYVLNNGSQVGTATTIDFTTNVDVSAIAAGILTVSVADSPTFSGDVSVGTGATTAFFDVSTGYVSIGTDGPNAKLHISGGNANDHGDGILLSKQGGNIYGIYPSTNNLEFKSVTGNTHIATFEFGGNIGIGTDNPISAKLHVQDGNIRISGLSENFLKIRNDNAGYDANISQTDDGSLRYKYGPTEALRIDSSGRLLVGTTNSLGNNHQFQVRNDSGSTGQLFTSVASTVGPYFGLNKSRGTAASPAVVQNNDQLGTVEFLGYSAAASAYRLGANIAAFVDGTPDSGGDTTDMPGRLVFSTTSDGANFPTERMRIDSSGRLLVKASSALTNFGIDSTTGFAPHFQVEGNDPSTAHIAVTRTSGVGSPYLSLAWGSSGNVPADGQPLGRINFNGYDGTDYRNAAAIAVEADGAHSGTETPGVLLFRTTPSGSKTPVDQMSIDKAGNLSFNSGYGSAAAAYGCRAWVNFNGTGTVAIRDSGNVSSITDNGTGNYTINFATAMPDANYSAVSMASGDQVSTASVYEENSSGTRDSALTTSLEVTSANTSSGAANDRASVNVAIFR